MGQGETLAEELIRTLEDDRTLSLEEYRDELQNACDEIAHRIELLNDELGH